MWYRAAACPGVASGISIRLLSATHVRWAFVFFVLAVLAALATARARTSTVFRLAGLAAFLVFVLALLAVSPWDFSTLLSA